MPRQVHRVVQDAEDFDYLGLTLAPDTKHHEMTPLSAMPGDMQREESPCDVAAFSCAGSFKSLAQFLQRSRERFGVDPCLSCPEPLSRPAQDFLDIRFSRCGESDGPVALGRDHFADLFSVTAFSASETRCRVIAFGD